jgi:putative transposase
MKKSKFTEAQIIFAIKQSEQGVRTEELCRKMGISEATFYNWKKKYGGLGVIELRELRMLKDENARLKKMVADLSLDKEMLQDVIKKALKPSQKKELDSHLSVQYKVSKRRSCRVLMIHHSVYYYQAHRREDVALRGRIREIAGTRVRYGHWRIYTLLRRE